VNISKEKKERRNEKMALREIRVSERMGNQNEREREREKKKKVSFKNWYVASSS